MEGHIPFFPWRVTFLSLHGGSHSFLCIERVTFLSLHGGSHSSLCMEGHNPLFVWRVTILSFHRGSQSSICMEGHIPHFAWRVTFLNLHGGSHSSLCMEGHIPHFAWRVTWNYAYSPFKAVTWRIKTIYFLHLMSSAHFISFYCIESQSIFVNANSFKFFLLVMSNQAKWSPYPRYSRYQRIQLFTPFYSKILNFSFSLNNANMVNLEKNTNIHIFKLCSAMPWGTYFQELLVSKQI